MNSNKQLYNILKTKFLSSGFINFGVSKPEILNSQKEYFKQWLDDNKNAGMQWLERTFEKRINPFLLMPDVKSIISLACLYNTPFNYKNDKNIPKISRYAYGTADYHIVIKEKIEKVIKEIVKKIHNVKAQIYVDDCDVMEKVWAVKSGLGWVGKNTIVLNENYGSFAFIATVFINVELDYNESVLNQCETCTMCIDSCPTGALFDEHKLDANLCISYHTIENKNAIPENINLNGWIFGCDICQDACPYNRRNIFSGDNNFFPDERIFNKSYEELEMIDENKFNEIFKNTPIGRGKYLRFQRNLKKAKK